jgi:hypothetical protein
MTRFLLLALMVGTSALQAQQHPIVGTWQLSFTAGMRMENGMSFPISGTGTLTVSVEGDSLVGTLVTDSIPDMARRPPARLAGKTGEGAVTLISRSSATLNMNGLERTAGVVNTWTLKVKGDSLEGTLERRIEGMDEMTPPPSPVTGTRRAG